MIVWQADPGWDDSDVTRAPVRDARTLAETDGTPDGFKDLLVALRDETVAFRRTVDPDSREVFSYQPQIVPGNRTAVPVP